MKGAYGMDRVVVLYGCLKYKTLIKATNLAYIVNVHLYFVMVTVPYLLYIPTRLYLNTTYSFINEEWLEE